MNVEITVRLIARNVIAQNDINGLGFPDLEEIVRWLIEEEELFNIVEDDYEIVSIEEVVEE